MTETKNATDHLRIEIAMAPVWDAHVDLVRLNDLLAAAIYLTGPDDGEDPEKAHVITALVTIQEKIEELAESLGGAIKDMKIVKAATA